MKKYLTIFLSLVNMTQVCTAQCTSDRPGAERLINSIDASTAPLSTKISRLRSTLDVVNRCQFKNDSVHVLLLELLAVNYLDAKDFRNAIKYYGEAINITKANEAYGAVHPASVIYDYFWMSTAYDSLHETRGKMMAIDSAIAAAIRLGRLSDIAYLQALYLRILYDSNVGDYARCIEDASMCEKGARMYMARQMTGTVEYMSGQELVSSSIGWYVHGQIMLRNFVTAQAYLQQLLSNYQAQGLDNYTGLIYSQLAALAMLKNNYHLALADFQLAFKASTRAGDQFMSKQILNNIGQDIFFLHDKNAKRAVAAYRQALLLHATDKRLQQTDRMESLNLYSNMGTAYVSQRHFDSAFKCFQHAFDQLEPGLTETKLFTHGADWIMSRPKLYFVLDLLTDKGDAYLAMFREQQGDSLLSKAIATYRFADQLLDLTRDAQFETQSKIFWRKASRHLYEQAIAACILQQNKSAAFTFFEKSKAVLLHDQLRQQDGMQSADRRSVEDLKKRIAALEQDTARNNDGKVEALFAARETLNRLLKTARNHDPFYAQGSEAGLVSLTKLQHQLLQSGQSLFEIFVGDSAVYSLFVGTSKIELGKIALPEFRNLSSRYLAYLTDADLINRDFAGFRKTSAALYQLLFRNIRIETARLIVSPEGKYFPFESLVQENSGPQPVYFLEHHAVSYAYSARFLNADFSDKAAGNEENLLGLAPVQYPRRFGIPSLRGSDVSLGSIARTVNETLSLTGSNASKQNFLSNFSGFRIVQLYTHASENSDRKEPVIYFSDSAMYLSDLTTVEKPRTKLVVLSACETAAGQLYEGEGIFSFNRGFAAMGIPSAISNLWSVDNLSTYELTELFYAELKQGVPIDIALQQAKLRFMHKSSDNRLPYYWASVVLVGKTDAVFTDAPRWLKPTLLALIAAALGALLFIGLRLEIRHLHRNRL